jgi:uncharacterized membrane protein
MAISQVQLSSRLRTKPAALRIVLTVAALFFVVVSGFSLHRYYSFYVTTDHAIFNQVFWNGIHGNFFQSSLSSVLSTNVVHSDALPTVSYHRLGQHFTPALLLWLPIYALFPEPVTLLVLQVLLITGAGLLLYALARHYLSPALSAVITLSFYGAIAVIGPALGNFYDLCQLPLYWFCLLLALEKRRWWIFGLVAVLILAIREDTGVVLFGLGLYLIWSKRYPKVGLAVCGASVVYILLVTNVIMPLFSQDISRRFMIERFGQFVTDQEASTPEVIWAMISQPWLLLQELITPVDETLKYLLGHWLPLAFVPAIAPPAWILTAFPLLQILLQRDTEPLSITIRYATAVVPGLFYGVILWWSRHPKSLKPAFRRFWLVCLSLSLLFTFTSNPHRSWSFLLPDSFDPWVYVPLTRQWEHVQQIQPILAEIPSGASIAASRYILPHVSNRRAVLPFARYSGLQYINDEGKTRRINYIVADLWFPHQYEAVFKDARNEVKSTVALLDRVLKRQYGIIAFRDGVILAQVDKPSDPVSELAWQNFRRKLKAESSSNITQSDAQ